MKRVFLLILVSALLVGLGFAQTPAANGNTDLPIKGCLGGSDGNYTVAEDNTGKIFKITTSSADLKPHLGQDVNLIGHKAGAAEDSLAVTEVNMISEHCTAAAAAPVASVSTPSETVITPVVATDAPATAEPAATVSTPPPAAAPTAAPDATVSTPSETAIAPAAAAAAPDATVSVPSETAIVPAAAAAIHRTRPSARPREPSETLTVAAAPAASVSTPAAAAAAAPVALPSESANTPAEPVAPAAKGSTSRSAGMLVSIVVVVLLVGAAVPLYNRWRKRKLLEQTRGENLSFTKEAKSDPGKSDTTGGRKAA
jgi:hypothetical protein